MRDREYTVYLCGTYLKGNKIAVLFDPTFFLLKMGPPRGSHLKDQKCQNCLSVVPNFREFHAQYVRGKHFTQDLGQSRPIY